MLCQADRQTTKMGYEHSKIISSIHTFFWCAFINDNGGTR